MYDHNAGLDDDGTRVRVERAYHWGLPCRQGRYHTHAKQTPRARHTVHWYAYMVHVRPTVTGRVQGPRAE